MAELSTSRINRQFRTLRMKCTSLNVLALTPSKPSVSVTYGNSRQTIRRPTSEDATPPLAILQSLENFGARLHLDRAIVENMQLSKRIYEVRDAFRNIVQSAFGPADEGNRDDTRRILPLTAICARLVGEHVQSEIDAAVEDVDESEDNEEDVRAQVMDDLYEDVPVAYRRHMFVAHVLAYILETCPHHPTLLNALLEVCLSQALVPETRTILSSFFVVAIGPRAQSAYPCPLNHPAHKNFLSTLRESCSETVINDRTFTHLLIGTLDAPSPTRLQAWTSKAVTRLARDLRERDFAGSFVPLCLSLASTLAEERPKPKPGFKSSRVPEGTSNKLYDESLERLAKWADSMLNVLHVSASDASHEAYACVDFLTHVAQYQLHVSDEPPASPSTCLADALVCLAAYCLASPHATSLHEHDLSTLRSILLSAHIKNTSFDGLVSLIFPRPRFEMFAMPLAEPEGADTPTPPPTLPDVRDGGMQALSALAAPLRTHGLTKCEAALWVAALQHVEELIASPTVTQSMTTPGRKLNQSQLYNLRLEFMDRMEEAERRCFGGGLGGGMAGTAPLAAEGEWEWEEMVGSWVLKSPAPALAKKLKEDGRAAKRRKVDGNASGQASRPQFPTTVRDALEAARPTPRVVMRAPPNEPSASARRPAPTSRPARMVKGKASSSASSSSSRAPSRSMSSKENSSDDDENAAPAVKTAKVSRPQKAMAPPPRRPSNFTTILADAQMNVVSLRAEREASAARAGRTSSVSHSSGRRFPAHTPPTALPLPISAPPTLAHSGRRRPSNFATLLADSQRNTISLREERARKAARQQTSGRYKRLMSDSEDTFSDAEEEYPADCQSGGYEGKGRAYAQPEPDSSPVRGEGMIHPSSDDALNLFAYPDSSPVRPH
ncbi:hypothetical protein C8Q79DRAFT_913270 [Trametes meyenii]|nr:hypothetical protein C8Q79DRAFT_913270 [Trametes meyenii]